VADRPSSEPERVAAGGHGGAGGGPDVPGGEPAGARGEPSLTLGTAGHIDHGKTALITRLTGTNTDRLREERERGISIELGYAELELPGGGRVSVVDVPGHERFVRTMVAGATGIDLFLLVVAADDGVMPQTVEHLAVIELLGVQRGVVALTKADLVDDELLELARADVAELLAATPYAKAPIVTVSARDGRGLPELLDALAGAAAATVAGRREGPARLPVDRIFALKGIGAVVTGTLWRGGVTAGDRLVVQPAGETVTVRSVQVHDRAVETAPAGRRVALNLRGVDRAHLERGVFLVAAGAAARIPPTRSFTAGVRLVGGSRPLKTGERVRLHHGTAQHVAHLSFFDRRELAPGAATVAVVRLDGGPAAVEPHDRFILRSLSPGQTIGGGVVLDASPRRFHERAAQRAFLGALEAGDVRQACLVMATDRGPAGLAAGELVAAGIEPEVAARALTALAKAGDLETVGGPAGAAAGERPGVERRWYANGTVAAVAAAVAALLARRADNHPENPFAALVALATAAPRFALDDLAIVAARLVERGELVERDGSYALAGAGDVLSDAHEALAARVGERLAAARFAPPTLASLEEELGAQRRDLNVVLEVLTRRGAVVRVDRDLWFDHGAVDEARERLTEALARRPEITLAEYRDLLGTGRRHAQALLELFDREGLTRRRGDARVPRAHR
jgi:selenocysteine-specific elongation factor